MNDQIIIAIIATVGGGFAAIMAYRSIVVQKQETPEQKEETVSKAFQNLLSEYRIRVSELEKESDDKDKVIANYAALFQKQEAENRMSLQQERVQKYDALKERNAYAANATQLRRIALRYAPKGTDLPEVDTNGSTPPTSQNEVK